MRYIWHAMVDGKFTTGEFEDDRDLVGDEAHWEGLQRRALELASQTGDVDPKTVRVRLPHPRR